VSSILTSGSSSRSFVVGPSAANRGGPVPAASGIAGPVRPNGETDCLVGGYTEGAKSTVISIAGAAYG
jgi:hypothetical protein